MMVGRLLSFWEGNFSGAMLNFGGVTVLKSVIQASSLIWCNCRKSLTILTVWKSKHIMLEFQFDSITVTEIVIDVIGWIFHWCVYPQGIFSGRSNRIIWLVYTWLFLFLWGVYSSKVHIYIYLYTVTHTIHEACIFIPTYRWCSWDR